MSSSFKSALNGDDEMNIIYAYKNSSHNWTVMITFFSVQRLSGEVF